MGEQICRCQSRLSRSPWWRDYYKRLYNHRHQATLDACPACFHLHALKTSQARARSTVPVIAINYATLSRSTSCQVVDESAR